LIEHLLSSQTIKVSDSSYLFASNYHSLSLYTSSSGNTRSTISISTPVVTNSLRQVDCIFHWPPIVDALAPRKHTDSIGRLIPRRFSISRVAGRPLGRPSQASQSIGTIHRQPLLPSLPPRTNSPISISSPNAAPSVANRYSVLSCRLHISLPA